MAMAFDLKHVVLSALAAGLALTACGAPEVKGPPPPTGPGPEYAVACKARFEKHQAAVASKAYVPVELLVHLWPSQKAGGAPAYMSEVDLAAALTATGASALNLQTALVMARGGTGKSQLAESLEAQVCGQIPFYRVDLASEVAPILGKLPSGVNPVAVAVASRMAKVEPLGAEAAIQAAMGNLNWVVVLDALDETPLLSREEIARAIDEFAVKLAPKGHLLVMTRPPVFTSNYGLKTVQGRLELPQLTCDQADVWLAEHVSTTEERQSVKDFMQHYGIDRKVTSFDRCHYPHMATYRDLQVVRALAHSASIDKNNPEFKNFQASRAQVYTYFVAAQLIRDLQGLPVPWTPQEAMTTVDAMVAAKNPDGGQRNFQFQLEECIAANALPDAPDKHSTCERLLQSSLFREGTEGQGIFHFDNQSLGDLFLARWTAAQLVGLDGKPDCKRLEEKAALLESNEIAGFLLGSKAGQACAVELAQSLCKRGGSAEHLFEQFDQGLPSGKARADLVVDALELLAPLGTPDACVMGIFDGLGKSVADLMPKKAEPAPAKGKKGKKGKGK